MKKNIILTDADDVLLDWTGPFLNWMKVEKGFKMNKPERFDLTQWFDVTRKQADDFIVEFNNQHVDVPNKDSQKVVESLHNKGFVFHVITAYGDSRELKNKREKRLKRLFGNAIWDVDVLDYGSKKDDVLKRYKNSGLYWVDDSLNHYQSGIENGLKSLLMMGDFNFCQEFPLDMKINKVNSWTEIEEMIT